MYDKLVHTGVRSIRFSGTSVPGHIGA